MQGHTRGGALGGWCAVGVVLLTVVAAQGLGGTASGLVAPAGAAAAALGLAHRRRDADLVSLTLWLWLLAPFARRVVDWTSIYHDVSPVLLAAPICSIVSLWSLRRSAGSRVLPAVGVLFALAATAYAFGSVMGLATVGARGAAAAAVELVTPMLLGYVVLVSPQRAALQGAVVQVARYGLLVVGGYALVQFFVLPPWDAQWIVQSGINSVGAPEPLAVRVFSTLNTAGPLGHTLSAMLLLLLGARPWRRLRWDVVAIVLGYAALGLSLVRAAWVCHVIGILVLLTLRRLEPSRVIAVGGLLGVALVAFGGPVAESVTGRLERSVEAGAQDYSLQERLEFQAELVQEVLTDPWGKGLGTTGVATQLVDDGTGFRSIDSGIFETVLTLGLLPGGALLAGLAAASFSVGRARTAWATPLGPGAAAVAVSLVSALAFTDTLKSAYGALLWVAFGLLGHRGALLAQKSAENRHRRTVTVRSGGVP